MNYENFLEVVKNRRSTRKFNGEEVTREEIEKIITAASHAPSGFNSQPWRFVVVDNPEVKAQISEFLIEGIGEGKTSKGFLDAPVYILVYGDASVREKAPAHLKDDNEWWEFTFNTSVNNAFMTAQLAASSLGLGTQWSSSYKIPSVEKKSRELLGLPDSYVAFEMMALGRADVSLGAKGNVKPLEEVANFNGKFEG